MKRIALVLVLIVYAGSGLYSQNSGSRDIILLLDTSIGTSANPASYEAISGYITRGFLREHLRIGNTFHLIPFSDRPFLDISRRITDRGDAETIIGRMFLHYPLYPRADIPAALSFAENYVSSLPERPKKIVLVSANNISAVGSQFEEMRARLARQNVTLEFVQIVPGRTAPVVTPSVVIPPVVTVTPPVVTEDTLQFEPDPFLLEPLPDPTLYAPEEDLNFAETVPPEQTLQEREPAAAPATAPTPKAKPAWTRPPIPVLSTVLKNIFTAKETVFTLSGIFWMLALIIPIFILAVVSGKMNFPKAATGTSGLLLMNLYVEDQNTYIGRRNIHALKPGYSYTVGGKDSDFLIFVVKVPPNLAKVRIDGKTVTFTPLLPRYFPNLGSVELKDCVGKTIRIISDKNYQLKIRFDFL